MRKIEEKTIKDKADPRCKQKLEGFKNDNRGFFGKPNSTILGILGDIGTFGDMGIGINCFVKKKETVVMMSYVEQIFNLKRV